MKRSIVGAVVLVLATPISVLLMVSGASLTLTKIIAITLATIGGVFQAYAFWQAWQDH